MALLGLAHPTFQGVLAIPILEVACQNVEYVVGIGEFAGSTPQSRRATMIRNFGIYRRLAEALVGHALANCKILIFSHPASIGARVVHHFAPLLPLGNITSLTRADQDMAAFFIADRIDIELENVQNLICWGITSSIQHVDITHGWIEPNNQAVHARIGNDNWVMVELTGAIRNCGMDIRTRLLRTAYINNVATSICNHIWDWCSETPAVLQTFSFPFTPI
ncbi:malate dehydrogenase 2, cytoplasmic-like [Syzygium oleosum]|uniref:malate dehydrogenase 2, cytoplasmic-like n=1 Tax=Syzygium oleosum TaxID=219896 RepID=UPI0024BA3117|nr:malate dehydrogenase 2, cytoplasmic-like [Syzygium oleosum]